MILRRAILLLTGLFLMGISEPLKEEKALVSKDVIMPTLLSCLTRQSITIKVPHYREFNANLPPRIPESSSPSLPGILQDIFNEERSHILLFWNKLISELC